MPNKGDDNVPLMEGKDVESQEGEEPVPLRPLPIRAAHAGLNGCFLLFGKEYGWAGFCYLILATICSVTTSIYTSCVNLLSIPSLLSSDCAGQGCVARQDEPAPGILYRKQPSPIHAPQRSSFVTRGSHICSYRHARAAVACHVPPDARELAVYST